MGLSLAKAGLRYLEHFAGHWVAFTMLTRMRTEFYSSLVPQAPAVAKGSGAAELSETATRDIDRVEVFAHTVPPTVSAIMVPLVASAWVWAALGLRPALIMLFTSALMIGIPFLTRRWSWPAVQAVGAVRARIAVHLGDSVQGIGPVQAFGAQSRRLAEENGLEDEVERPLRRIRRFAGATGGEMTVDGVVFHYPGASEPTLTGIKLGVPGGQWSYLAGVSGSGKSTLAALLARGYDPNQGAVQINGTDLRSLPLDELRARVALVVQRPCLLRASLADNLRLSAPRAVDDELLEALRSVGLDQWANEGGLAQEIAADGGNLSGGQVQRVAIARALLGRPEVLILDEATSQIDEATAGKVRAGVQASVPGMTVLEISHQVDRVPEAAHVAVIDEGEVVEQGAKGTLMGQADGCLSRLAAR